MVQRERDVRAAAALAASTGRADPAGPDLLQCVAAEHAAAVATLLAPTASGRARDSVLGGWRCSGSLERRSCWRLVARLHLRRPAGRRAELASYTGGALDDRFGRLVSSVVS